MMCVTKPATTAANPQATNVAPPAPKPWLKHAMATKPQQSQIVVANAWRSSARISNSLIGLLPHPRASIVVLWGFPHPARSAGRLLGRLEIAEGHAAGAADVFERQAELLHETVHKGDLRAVLHGRADAAIRHVRSLAAAVAVSRVAVELRGAVDTRHPVDLEYLDRLDILHRLHGFPDDIGQVPHQVFVDRAP